MKLKNAKALKEWATIVKALGEGKQTILIRKQNLRLNSDEFLLYPTFSGQIKDKLKDRFHSDFDAAVAARRKDEVMIEFYAQIKEVYEVTDSTKFLELDTQYVWTFSHVEDYFCKTKDKKLYVIILRILRLPKRALIEPSGPGSIVWVNLRRPISTQGCLPVLKDPEFENATENIKKVIGKAPTATLTTQTVQEQSREEPNHTEIKNMIHDIGLCEERSPQKEYSIGALGRLDVVWKRIRLGNPTHAFEVQVGGDFYKSLAKLKHAFDLWNSTPVLVTTAKYEEMARNLMQGSFHEMARKARIINWKRIEQLFQLETQLTEVKKELRL